MNTETLPKFEGKPLIKNPSDIPQADFLAGDFGKAVLKEYQGRVKQSIKTIMLSTFFRGANNRTSSKVRIHLPLFSLIRSFDLKA